MNSSSSERVLVMTLISIVAEVQRMRSEVATMGLSSREAEYFESAFHAVTMQASEMLIKCVPQQNN